MGKCQHYTFPSVSVEDKENFESARCNQSSTNADLGSSEIDSDMERKRVMAFRDGQILVP